MKQHIDELILVRPVLVKNRTATSLSFGSDKWRLY